MNYEQFKNVITQNIKKYLPEEFQNYRVEIQEIRKIGEEKEALLVTPQKTDGTRMFPNIYLDDLYREFSRTGNMLQIFQIIAELIKTHTGEFDLEHLLHAISDQNQIVANLIDIQSNKAWLEEIPHTKFLDMAVIYRSIIETNEEGMKSCILTKEHLNRFGWNVEELHRKAIENIKKIFPTEIIQMGELQMYIATNREKNYGATALLQNSDLLKLGEQMGTDYYIIPSSIHEFLSFCFLLIYHMFLDFISPCSRRLV